MSPALILLFVFMTCTFTLGLFLGWALWRHGGVSRSAMGDLEAKVDFLKKSLDKSRMELWNLQDQDGVASGRVTSQNRPISRRRTVESTITRTSRPSTPAEDIV